MKGHWWVPCSPMGSSITLRWDLGMRQGISNMGSGCNERGTGGFPAHLWVVWSHYGWSWVCGKVYQMWVVDEGGSKLHSFGLGEFPKFPWSPKFHTDMQAMSRRHVPKAPKRNSGAVRCPAGIGQCWCGGFNVGCGLIRTEWMCQLHATKERKLIKGIISTMIHYIHRRSLTLQL